MDIHKPKPVHNWRDFLKEVGIIVLGIVIAIGMEQAAQAWHWHGEVKAARQAITAEMAVNNRNFFARRIAIAPCVNRQIREADAILGALKARQKPGAFTTFRRSFTSLITDSEWDAERASQVLTHFPREELARMSRYYAAVGRFDNWGQMEAGAWQELSILQDPPSDLTTADLIRLRVNLSIVERMEDVIVLNARRQLGLTRQLGVPAARPEPEVVKAFCTLSDTDYIRFIAAWERV